MSTVLVTGGTGDLGSKLVERRAEYIESGVQELMLTQWPRFHRESPQRFSAEVIPAFR